ncbi:MAG: M56 family metallopeptidase, partial [Chloroflexi bacterium]|nr:M56 family metallopeptidase [Chloroflexota bacterium]
MSGLDVATADIAGLAARATLILCLALLVTWLARRGSARTLHLFWTTTFVALLALPALSLLGPSWSVPILPARDIAAEGASLEASGDGVAKTEAPRHMVGRAVSSGPSRRVAGARTSSGFPTVDSGRPELRAGDAPAPLTPSGIAFLIWALGCGAALTSLAVGSLRFRKLVREAAPVRDLLWRQQSNAMRRRLRVRSQVQILMSPKVPTPMAGGPWRPVILLPSDAEDWSPERRAVVLAHELIHVRRRDALREVVGRAAVALYWFHPLSWPAWRAATIAAERSCDEEVLALGTRPSEYARHLFSLASGTADGRALLALPMVHRSQLENRIMSILKRHRPRYSLARTIAALAGIGVAGTLIACANPVPRDPAAQAAPRDQAIAPGEVQARDRVIPAPSPEPPSAASPEDMGTRSVAGASAMPEPASVGNATPVRPEVAQDATRQALECNPGSGSGVMRRAGEWTLQRRVDGMRLCMRSHGNVEMAPDGTSIQTMEDDSWLVLESQAERLHRLVITPGPGGLEYDWSIDGRSQAFDDEAEAWRDLMLTVMDGYLNVQEIRGEEASLRGQIAAHRGHIATLRGGISTHRGHASALRGQIAVHSGHVATLRGAVAMHRGHVAGLRGRMHLPAAEVARVMSRVAAQVELVAN